MTAIDLTDGRGALHAPALRVVLYGTAATYLAGRAVFAILDPAAVDAWRLLVGVPLFGLASLVCLVRANAVERDRRAWRLFAAGIAIYPIGTITTELWGHASSAPAIAHLAWLAFYVCAYLAIIDLARTAIRPYPLGFLLDGLVGAIAAIAIAALTFEFVGAIPYRMWEASLGLAYPLLDGLLLAATMWVSWLGQAREHALWRRLGLAFVVMQIGDLTFVYAAATESLSSAAVYTAAYPIAMVILASAAWVRPPTPSPLRSAPARSLMLPGLSVIACLTVVAIQLLADYRGPAAALALLGLALAFVRGALVFRDLDAAREGRRYSEAGLRISRTALVEQRPEDLLPGLVHELGAAIGSEGVALVVQHSDPEQQAEVVGAPAITDALAEALRAIPAPLDGALTDGRSRRVELADARAAPALRTAMEASDIAALEVFPIEPTVGPAAAICIARSRMRRPLVEAERQFLSLAANVAASALDRTRREEISRHRSLHDPLTGLANRALLTAHLEHAIERGRRDGTQVGVVLFDLDRFKIVNDTLGHAAGDALLKDVAAILRKTSRGGDLLARLGGDEFVVVFDSVDSVEEVVPFAERLVEALDQPLRVAHRDVYVGASAGLVTQAARDATADTLLRDADVAMYRAKERGGHRHEIFDATLRAGVVRRASTEQLLRHAVERGEMRVAYQPQVAVDGSGVRGFEALLRWQRPGVGLVPPAQFVPVAEDAGLISELGAWVLGTSCHWAAQVSAPGCREPRIAVNVSARQITSELPAIVDQALRDSGLPANRLCLEITESLLVSDGAAVEILEGLRGRGVTLSLDDFGTGWSSLGALQRHAVDELKIDRSMIAAVDTVAAARALARAVVDMAGAFGLSVVAEGVERQHQLDVVRELGCGLAQGFYFAPALWADEVDEYLSSRRWRD